MSDPSLRSAHPSTKTRLSGAGGLPLLALLLLALGVPSVRATPQEKKAIEAVPAAGVSVGGARTETLASETVRVKRSIDAGLSWLASHQQSDGSWHAPRRGNTHHDIGVTGLALLAFLGDGQTHRTGPHQNVIRAGLEWLKNQQDAEGCFGPRANHAFTYDHALATLAVCEVYGLTQSAIHRQTAQNGVNFALQCQNPYKGWRYGVRPGDNDTSITSWMVMALKSAKSGGLEVSATSFEWARDLLEELTDAETGRTGYTKRGERPVRAEGRIEEFPPTESECLTAMAMTARMFCGEDPKDSVPLKLGATLLQKRLPAWEPKGGAVDMIYWYFGTLATYQMGGAHWTTWAPAMHEAVLEGQVAVGGDAGSWPPIGPWGTEGGRVYATTLMTLCLEIEHRYRRVQGR